MRDYTDGVRTSVLGVVMSPHTAHPPAGRWLAETHVVRNQPPPLEGYNLYRADSALREGVHRYDAGWAEEGLISQGAWAGQTEVIELGFQANEHPPRLETHDRFGHRVDAVRYHPAYHRLMRRALEQGLHAAPWREPGLGAQVARAARYYLQAQVEAGHGCPVTMSFAAVPALQRQPAVAAPWLERLLALGYEPDNRPAMAKRAITFGMAMTEKQGGSDVRANTTWAYPVTDRGAGEAYELVGHKYFVSAPMSDAFLALAQTEAGLSCFLLPRWRPDGSRNPLQLQQLKRKMGNVSNASAEAELRGALAWMLGEPGRGINAIIEMVAMTRYDCVIGSSAGMRQAVAQALHHAHYRYAFGARLADQPLMRNLLADLALESEAALQLALRLARALDRPDDAQERALFRLATPVGKYWVCKRAPGHAYEAMEVIGGSGVMENGILPRLFREAPINAIWEGSGNIQCLDVLRAVEKAPESLDAFLRELDQARGVDRRYDAHLRRLRQALPPRDGAAYRARRLVDGMATALQAALLLRHSEPALADAYCAARLSATGVHHYGTLPDGVDCPGIIRRATPML